MKLLNKLLAKNFKMELVLGIVFIPLGIWALKKGAEEYPDDDWLKRYSTNLLLVGFALILFGLMSILNYFELIK